MSLNIIRGIENFHKNDHKTVVTIGTFDGVHRGHQAILKKLADTASKRNLPPLAITFEPHPRVLVTPDSPPPLLTCLNEKIRLFTKYFEGTFLVLNFNDHLKNLNAEEFTTEYLVEKMNLAKLIVGYDHAFGKNRSGTINDLMNLSRRYSFELEIVDPVIVDGRPISSTRIRKAMAGNNYSQALSLLGHPYPIGGRVIRGIGLGKKIGYPTANLEVSSRKLLPADGVYSCRAEMGKQTFDGMMFIGKNNFNPGAERSVEVNLFDFNEDIYDREIFCYPEIFIRENRKYTETSELIRQLEIDKKNVLMSKE
nr:bifunctional riboflavin kinase/FAD synthetase [candidate division Zixibacteria bacterium]